MLIEGRNLFDLRLAREAFRGYYMDASGNIFSNKSGKIKAMMGSATASGKYYTLNGQTYSGSYVKQMATNVANNRFYNETKATLGAPAAVDVSAGLIADGFNADRSYAANVADGIKRRGTVIASVQDSKLVFGSNPKIHVTEKSWKSEIERLARHNPGITFIALDIKTAVVAQGITWL